MQETRGKEIQGADDEAVECDPASRRVDRAAGGEGPELLSPSDDSVQDGH